MNALANQTTNKKIRMIMDLRTKGVSDMNVLAALEKVPRTEFLPDAVKHQAWEDLALPIGLGQTISQPLVVASMTQALKIRSGDTVLEIGTGCGYQTAILAQLCRRVYTIERHKPLAQGAQERLDRLRIRNVTAIAADGMRGWPSQGRSEPMQFDKIIVTAGARRSPPQALIDQIKVGGAMVIPVGEDADTQVLKRYTKREDGSTEMENLMAVRFVPLLPDVE